jgi:hypothetical protein
MLYTHAPKLAVLTFQDMARGFQDRLHSAFEGLQ